MNNILRTDLNCPAEILRVEGPADGMPYGVLTLFNLTDRTLVSCEATLRLTDGNGREAGRTVHRARALTGRPHSVFQMNIPMEAPPGARRAEAVLDKVWFQDNDVWRRNPANEIEYESNALPPGNSLNALKYSAGENAVGYPSQQANLWVCVCGRPNSNRSEICGRCQRQKSMIFSRYSPAQVEQTVSMRERQLDLKSRSAREEANMLQRLREEEYNREQRRKKRRGRLIAAFCGAAAAAALALFAVVPGLKLTAARAQTERGDYARARASLISLGNFPGAPEALEECELRSARQDAGESRDADTLKSAAAVLRKSGDEQDLSLANGADFARAALMMEAGNIPEAEELLRSLQETWPGRSESLNACAYARGKSALEDRDYEKAREIFLGLGNYLDSEDMAKACLYEPALGMMEAGKYDEAVKTLSSISDYADSGELILKCNYLKGFTLEKAGDYDAAREAYQAAGNYDDARERANTLLMAKADALDAGGDWAEALELYRELDGWGEARLKWESCAMALASQAIKSRDYALAISYLEVLPERSGDAEDQLNRAIYLEAGRLAGAGNYQEAIDMMSRAPGYRDGEGLIRSWKYSLARGFIDEEKWAEAIPLLEEIEGYKLSSRLLRKARQELEKAQKLELDEAQH